MACVSLMSGPESRVFAQTADSPSEPMRSVPLPSAGRSPFAMGPPAEGPYCESVRLPTPDNVCAAWFKQTHGTGRNAQASVTVRCSSESDGFEEEVLRIFADRPVPLRWINDATLEIGLPTDARFSPPPQSVERSARPLRYVYKPVSSGAANEAAGCFDPPEDYRKVRLLSGEEKRSATEPSWVAYGSGQTCMLAGQTATPADALGAVSTQFMRTASARLPYGTAELVFAVVPHRVPPDAPTLQLPGEPQPLALLPNGPGAGYRLVGASSERVLKELQRGGKVVLSFKADMGVIKTASIDLENFGPASTAFETCARTLVH